MFGLVGGDEGVLLVKRCQPQGLVFRFFHQQGYHPKSNVSLSADLKDKRDLT